MGTTKDTKSINDKNIFALSICALLYFGFLHLNATNFKLEYAAISFLQELLTIPIIIGQLMLLVLSWIHFKQNSYSIKSLAFASMILLTASNVFVFISFLRR